MVMSEDERNDHHADWVDKYEREHRESDSELDWEVEEEEYYEPYDRDDDVIGEYEMYGPDRPTREG